MALRLSRSVIRISDRTERAKTGPVLVIVGSASGLASNSDVILTLPNPVITSAAPASGGYGTQLTISGSGFGSSQGSVTFNGVAASVQNWSDTQIATTVPVGATTGPIVVTVGGVPSNGTTFTVPTPQITSINPTTGPVGTPVTITGSNFGSSQNGGTITFNEVAGSVVTWHDTQIVATVPASAISGAVVVKASGVSSNADQIFTVPPPVVASINPTTGVVGTPVTITGTGFGTATGYAKFNGSNAVASYTQGAGIDEPLAIQRGGYTAYYQSEGLGSVTSLTGSTGQTVATYVYDTFGNTTATEGIFNPFRYTGREHDPETELYYYRARYYNPTIGRFISEDPMQFRTGVNFYAYALNNPIRFTDPSGLDVVVCYYPQAAHGLGQVGFGVSGEGGTQGFYPLFSLPGGSSWRTGQRIYGSGIVLPDVNEGQQVCLTIKTSSNTDQCMRTCRNDRSANPGTYNLATRQCTSFVRDCLRQCRLAGGYSESPSPGDFFGSLSDQLNGKGWPTSEPVPGTD